MDFEKSILISIAASVLPTQPYQHVSVFEVVCMNLEGVKFDGGIDWCVVSLRVMITLEGHDSHCRKLNISNSATRPVDRTAWLCTIVRYSATHFMIGESKTSFVIMLFVRHFDHTSFSVSA